MNAILNQSELKKTILGRGKKHQNMKEGRKKLDKLDEKALMVT